MAQIIKTENLSFELNQSPIAEFSWYTSPRLSELFKSEHLKFDNEYWNQTNSHIHIIFIGKWPREIIKNK